jgi:hypothetical protein
MRIDVVREMPADDIDAAWDFYEETFGKLRVQAALRQVLHRDEFHDLMVNTAVDKYVCTDAGEVVGLAVMSDDLDPVPQISPEYFAHRWPDLYAERRIFYVVFVAARPGAAGAYLRLIRQIVETVTAAGGIAIADVCSHNEDEYRMPEMFALAARRVTAEAHQQRLDAQSFWLYEFPAAMRAVPAGG